MDRKEAITAIRDSIVYQRVHSTCCTNPHCRDYYECKHCGECGRSEYGIDHTIHCLVTKLIEEFGEGIIDEAF